MKKSFLAAGLVAAVFIAILSGCAKGKNEAFLNFNNPEYITSEEQTLTLTPTNISNGDYHIIDATYILRFTNDNQLVSQTEATYDEASGTFSTDRFTVVKHGNDVILHVLENETPYLVQIVIIADDIDDRYHMLTEYISVTQLPQGMTPDEIE